MNVCLGKTRLMAATDFLASGLTIFIITQSISIPKPKNRETLVTSKKVSDNFDRIFWIQSKRRGPKTTCTDFAGTTV